MKPDEPHRHPPYASWTMTQATETDVGTPEILAKLTTIEEGITSMSDRLVAHHTELTALHNAIEATNLKAEKAQRFAAAIGVGVILLLAFSLVEQIARR